MKWYKLYWGEEGCRNETIQANREPTEDEVRERLEVRGPVTILEVSTPQVWYLNDGWRGTEHADASKRLGAADRMVLGKLHAQLRHQESNNELDDPFG